MTGTSMNQTRFSLRTNYTDGSWKRFPSGARKTEEPVGGRLFRRSSKMRTDNRFEGSSFLPIRHGFAERTVNSIVRTTGEGGGKFKNCQGGMRALPISFLLMTILAGLPDIILGSTTICSIVRTTAASPGSCYRTQLRTLR